MKLPSEAIRSGQPLPNTMPFLTRRGTLITAGYCTKRLWPLSGNQELREKLATRVKYLIVDGYQDVNPLQECLVRLLHDLGAQLCVVGDDDQTIYQWNGSDIDNILSFAKRYPGVWQISLAE